MSMTRTDALTQLAAGLRKFDGCTAAQVLAAEWPGLKGLHSKDIEYFKLHADKPASTVAQACQGRSLACQGRSLARQGRSLARHIDPLA